MLSEKCTIPAPVIPRKWSKRKNEKSRPNPIDEKGSFGLYLT